MTLTEGRLGFVFQKVPAFAANGSNRYRIERPVREIDRLGYTIAAHEQPGSRFQTRVVPGRSIAFLRELGPSRTGVFLISAIGGAERKLAEIDSYDLSMDPSLAWSPDGKWLATTDRSSVG